MRTTKGFERVDVIYRRIDDDFLDPKAFRARFGARRARADGRLPGRPRRAGQRARHRRRRRQGRLRLRAARSSSTTWAKRLIIPNVPTYRLRGRRRIGKYVLANLDEAGGQSRRTNPAATACSSARTRPRRSSAEFAKRIEANPRNYIAQPTLSLSRVPTIVDEPLRGPARRSAAVHPLRRRHLRAAGRADARRACARVRSSSTPRRAAAARTPGCSPSESRDGDDPRRRRTGWPGPTRQQAAGVGARGLMLSRVADSIYWMSRYVERAENVARFIDVNLQPDARPAGRPGPAVGSRWCETTGDQAEFAKRYGAATQRERHPVPDLRSGEPQLDPSPACAPRARTPARCARSSRRRCGSRSTSST